MKATPPIGLPINMADNLVPMSVAFKAAARRLRSYESGYWQPCDRDESAPGGGSLAKPPIDSYETG